MLGQIPFAGLVLAGNSTLQAISTTPAVLTLTAASATARHTNQGGDPAVKPDAANSRIVVNAPGIYRVDFSATGTASGSQSADFQVRKGGTAQAGARTKVYVGTNPVCASFSAVVEVTAADIPTSGGVATFSDPVATAGAGKPNGGFAGAGAAPKTGVAIDIGVTGGGSVNLTVTDAQFTVTRLG